MVIDMVEWIDNLILQYLTLDNIVKYSNIVLLCIVCWTFWGKSWVMEQINKGQEYYEEKKTK